MMSFLFSVSFQLIFDVVGANSKCTAVTSKAVFEHLHVDCAFYIVQNVYKNDTFSFVCMGRFIVDLQRLDPFYEVEASVCSSPILYIY